MSYLVEDQLLLVFCLLEADIFNGIVIQDNIPVPHLPGHPLILMITPHLFAFLLLLFLLAQHHRTLKHHFPIFLPPKSLKFHHHFLIINLTFHQNLNNFLNKIEIFFSYLVHLMQNLLYRYVCGDVLIQIIFELFLGDFLGRQVFGFQEVNWHLY